MVETSSRNVWTTEGLLDKCGCSHSFCLWFVQVEQFRCELLKALHVDDVDSTSHDALTDKQVSRKIEKMNLSM